MLFLQRTQYSSCTPFHQEQYFLCLVDEAFLLRSLWLPHAWPLYDDHVDNRCIHDHFCVEHFVLMPPQVNSHFSLERPGPSNLREREINF